MPPSVTRGSTVPHLASGKNPDDRPRPSTAIDRPRTARPAKIHLNQSDHPSDPSSNPPVSSSWQPSSGPQRQYPIFTRQAQRQAMQTNPGLRNKQEAQPVAASQPEASEPMGARQGSHQQQKVTPSPQLQPSQLMPKGHRQNVTPRHTQQNQQQGQKQQGQPQHRVQLLPQQCALQGQPPQASSQQQQTRTYLASRHPQHTMYVQQQHMPQQHMQQHLSQRHVSQQPMRQQQQARQSPPSQMASQHVVSQQRLSLHQQQMRSHQSPRQQQKSTLQQSTQQYVQARQMSQAVQRQQQQAQQQYQRGPSQDAQTHLTQMQRADQTYPAAGSKNEFDQRYQQQPVHHFQQQAQKNHGQGPNAQDAQPPHLQTQQVHQTQPPPSQQMRMAQGAHGASNVNPGPAMANGSIHNGQLYPVAIGLPPNAMSSSGAAGMQYTGSYTSTGLFDPLNMNPSGIPLANVGIGQPTPSQAVNVVRDLDRQGQHAQIQQMPGRSGVHLSERNAVMAQDLQRYVEHGQQQVAHRSGMQGQPQQDLQGHVIAPHQVQPTLYQPLEQQSTQHLVLNQDAALVQQQGAVVMHNQAGQLPQQTPQLSPQDDQLDQTVYHNQSQSQLNGTAAGGMHGGDVSARKGISASPQQELLQWNGNNPNPRVIGSGLQQQANGNMTNAMASGSLITQSQLLEMGVADGRHQPQSGLGQVPQQMAMQTAQQGALSNARRMPAPGDNGSPRKRRQISTGAGVTPALDSSRSFSCSGCGQDFARKRDRDNHVRTVHERSFSCTKCQARFKTKSDANRHIRIVHERVRPYPCPSCPSMFSERNKLRRHKETVHEKLRPYVCPVCSARFGELGNLRQHTGSLHPDYQVESAPGRTRVNHQVQS